MENKTLQEVYKNSSDEVREILKSNYKRNLEKQNKEFWIDRYGNIIKYSGDLFIEIMSMHHEIAAELYPNIEYPKDYLLHLGWVMVGSIVYSFPILHGEPTQSQINTLDKLGLFEDTRTIIGDSFILIKDLIC